jgi:hypothetical protein
MPELTVTLTPKIDQPGPNPGPAGNAASVGMVTLTPNDPDRLVRVYERVGAGDPWEQIKSGQIGPDGTMRFVAWASREYYAAAPVDGNKQRITSPVKGYNWDLIFDEDFDDNNLHPAWKQRGTEYTSKATHSRPHPDAFDVSGGVARLKVIDDPNRDAGYYLNGHVGTHQDGPVPYFTFTYGWAAARVKFHRWSGAHGAFWLQSPGGYVAGNAEVDIAEWFGVDSPSDPDMCHNLYWSKDNDGDPEESWKRQTSVRAESNWWDEFHVYSVNWRANRYEFYIDGDKVFTAREGLSDSPKFLVLSLSASDYEVDQMHRDALPYVMQVDWVRVWD